MTFGAVFPHVLRPAFGPGLAGGGNGLLNNLIAYWPLNEAGGANNALDAHTNGLTLTQVSSPGADTGKVYATARTFDAVADYFYRDSEALLQTGDVDFTIAAWVKIAALPAVSGVLGLVSKYRLTASANREYLLRLLRSPSVFEWRVSNDGAASTAITASMFGAPSLNTWYLLLADHNAVSNTISISVNGGAVNSAAHATGVYQSNARFAVGTYDDGALLTYHNGSIGPVAMWKSAAGGGGVLSAAQRTALWANGNGLPYSSFTT